MIKLFDTQSGNEFIFSPRTEMRQAIAVIIQRNKWQIIDQVQCVATTQADVQALLDDQGYGHIKALPETHDFFKSWSADHLVDKDADGLPTVRAKTQAELDAEQTNYFTWSSNEFMDLLTADEEDAIYADAETHRPTRQWLDKMLAADYIRSDDPRTVNGMGYLVSRGLLTEGRVTEILNGNN